MDEANYKFLSKAFGSVKRIKLLFFLKNNPSYLEIANNLHMSSSEAYKHLKVLMKLKLVDKKVVRINAKNYFLTDRGKLLVKNFELLFNKMQKEVKI
jgi:predicted transcriptional regulator